jgi:putative flippase GtrA
MSSDNRHKLIVQFLKYMVGGGVYFWGGLLIFAFCFSFLGWGWLPSKMLADVAGWTANYAIQRYWAFSDKKLEGHGRQVATRYILVNGIDVFIDYGIVGGLYSLGITPYIGFFVSAGFTTVWDYLWYRFWVFKPK